MRLIDVSRQRAQIVETHGKPYHAVSITDDATRYTVVTSTLSDGRLTYTVGVWRVDRPALR
jgi:hypothetical protein